MNPRALNPRNRGLTTRGNHAPAAMDARIDTPRSEGDVRAQCRPPARRHHQDSSLCGSLSVMVLSRCRPGLGCIGRCCAMTWWRVRSAVRRRQDYRRWERGRSMELWQMDVMGRAFLADGREMKFVTGIDDHSRFVVCARVVVRATARPVCDALVWALRTHGVPEQILTDNAGSPGGSRKPKRNPQLWIGGSSDPGGYCYPTLGPSPAAPRRTGATSAGQHASRYA